MSGTEPQGSGKSASRSAGRKADQEAEAAGEKGNIGDWLGCANGMPAANGQFGEPNGAQAGGPMG